MKRMKRVPALLLCLLLCMTYLPGPLFASAKTTEVPAITLSGVVAEPGEEAVISVELSKNPGVMVMLFEISYDHDLLTLTGWEDAGLTGWEANGDNILWLGEKDTDFNGTILRLNFRAAAAAGPGDLAVTLVCGDGGMGNHDEKAFLPKITPGGVHIHGWDEPTYAWAEDNSSVTAQRVCSYDAGHVETQTVRTSGKVTKAATCEEAGETTYTAAFTNPAFSAQTRTVADIPATGHDYELTGWNWTGYTAAKAAFACRNDKSHMQTVSAAITSVRTEPTSEKDGSVVYTATATFEGKTYTDTKTEVLPATGPTEAAITARIEDGALFFDVILPAEMQPGDAQVLIAWYEDTGRMAGCTIQEAADGTLPDIDADCTFTLMLTGKDFRPLAPAAAP